MDEQALIAELLALEEGEAETAVDLSNRIVIRQKQDRVYTQWVDVDGMALIGTQGIEDADFNVASQIMLHMTAKRPELRQHLSADTGFYFAMFDPLEYELIEDLPEKYEMSYGVTFPLILWNGVCRFNGDRIKACIAPSGLKLIQTRIRYRGQTCREAGYPTDDYWCYYRLEPFNRWDVFIHEFAHAIDYAIAVENGGLVRHTKMLLKMVYGRIFLFHFQ